MGDGTEVGFRLHVRVEGLTTERSELQATLARVLQKRDALHALTQAAPAPCVTPPRTFTALPESTYGVDAARRRVYATMQPSASAPFRGSTNPGPVVPTDPYSTTARAAAGGGASSTGAATPAADAGGGGFGRGRSTVPPDPYASYTGAYRSGNDA